MKLRTVIAVLLALLAAALSPVRIFAETQPVYIADVMVGTGESADEAKKAITNEGFTVLDRNLNEGAGSALKTEKFVYLGYKTTNNRLEALTDLAVMNMNGGYSFSDYAVLMDKYRDSQIKPFVDSFMASIEEYRANYNSDIDANRAKAEYAYTVLSKIFNEDCGNNMAELLLNPTKEERGLTDDQYKALSDEEKKTTVDLTTTLMQGNTQVVMLMEQMLAMATDTNEDTWLQRLSELGPEGLEEQYAQAGVRPADASREMASLYNDSAKKILESWDELRSGLLECDEALADEQVEDAPDVDISEFTQFDVGNSEETTIDLLDPEEMIPYYEEVMQNSADIADEAQEHSYDAVYFVLKETPYGDGTMYDFFTLPYGDVSGANISALYPMVSTLTEGQTAALDFLTTPVLAQIGATGGDAFAEFDAENSDLLDGIDGLDTVSLYYGVNRELFGDKTALTSEVLRENALVEKAYGMTDPRGNLGGMSALTALSWATTGVTLLMTAISAFKYSSATSTLTGLMEKSGNLFRSIQRQFDFTGSVDAVLKPLTNLAESTGLEGVAYENLIRIANERTVYNISTVREGGSTVLQLSAKFNWGHAKETLEIYNMKGILTTEEYQNLINFNDTKVIDSLGDFDGMNMDFKKLDELQTHIDDLSSSQRCALSKSQKFWRGMEIGFGVAFAVLTLISIGMTVYDLYRYYNIDYTPIPKYIVDEADVTATDAAGNQIVVRNDAAYYAVAKTNRPKTHEQFKALDEYADLNGDVGKEWLALYCTKNPAYRPILADSFTVVTGSTSIPDGYEKSVHMFGSSAAANLTDSRYTYNDDLNGIYVYFKTDDAKASSSDTASVFSGGTLALVGSGSALVGAAVGALAVNLVKRKKKPQAA